MKIFFVILLNLIYFYTRSQTNFYIQDEIEYEYLEDSFYFSQGEGDIVLRQRFHTVFSDKKMWDEFILDDNKYILLESDFNGFYGLSDAYKKYKEINLRIDDFTLDTLISKYYRERLKNFKYDKYRYAMWHKSGGKVEELYTFYSDNNTTRSYLLTWDRRKIIKIKEEILSN